MELEALCLLSDWRVGRRTRFPGHSPRLRGRCRSRAHIATQRRVCHVVKRIRRDCTGRTCTLKNSGARFGDRIAGQNTTEGNMHPLRGIFPT